jgi:hypothetical protein
LVTISSRNGLVDDAGDQGHRGDAVAEPGTGNLVGRALPGWQARRIISDETIRELLRWAWGLGDGTRVARHDVGMGLQTWIVDQGGRRWVAKSVAPHLAESFAHGLQVARLLGEAGISTGAPVPALSGPDTVDAAARDDPERA